MEQKIIGRKEFISLPYLHLKNITCKIDTGAYTSSLHCKNIHVINENEVEFIPLDANYRKSFKNKSIIFPIHKQKIVKSSNGNEELRVLIKTDAIFFGKKYKIILSLANRSSMKNPILIGRNFISKKFLVDVSKTFITKEMN